MIANYAETFAKFKGILKFKEMPLSKLVLNWLAFGEPSS